MPDDEKRHRERRDAFARAALTGLLSNSKGYELHSDKIGVAAAQAADAAMRALDGPSIAATERTVSEGETR